MRTRILLSFALLLTGTVALAQTAQINGTIRDASGLAIPGATVKATQTATGVSRTAISGADGGYVLPNLPIGPYLLEVTKEGFNKYAQSGIVLEVNTAPTLDVGMKVGSVSEQVTVEAAAIQVETRTQSVGQVVDTARVLEMPLNGREVHELIFLAGMANYPGTASLNTVRNYPTVVVSVAGGAPDSVSYSLDGLIHQDPYNNLSLPLPFPDALQEFKVETSAIPAQYGYHSTATVNAVTKSGTNEFHGDLFEFLRNGDLNANDFFNNSARPYRPRDTLKRNQFGGTIGGPIRKDKLFFFGGYQRTSLLWRVSADVTALRRQRDYRFHSDSRNPNGRFYCARLAFVQQRCPHNTRRPVQRPDPYFARSAGSGRREHPQDHSAVVGPVRPNDL
jgi:hypothetical protein